jgi:hypothetical protein
LVALLNLFFAPANHDKMKKKAKRRYFVEVGAVNGKYLSNTLTLEEEFGWGGLCIEPSSQFNDLLKSGRSCTMAHECVGRESGKRVSFVESTMRLPDLDQGKQVAGNSKPFPGNKPRETALYEMALDENGETYGVYSGMSDYFQRYNVAGTQKEMITKSLRDVLKGAGSPHYIDYISIDTEGSELDILRGFFESSPSLGHDTVDYTLAVISVEHVRFLPWFDLSVF